MLTLVASLNERSKWDGALGLWECHCGKRKKLAIKRVRKGDIQSCGCLRWKHNMSKSPEHLCWKQMRIRCNSKTAPNYKDYGGRGIKVCERWDSFANFFADMGPRPSPQHSIDRRDNNGDYDPGNCRWEMPAIQTTNRRNSLVFYIEGRKFESVMEAARTFNVTTQTIRDWTLGSHHHPYSYPPKAGCFAVKKYKTAV